MLVEGTADVGHRLVWVVEPGILWLIQRIVLVVKEIEARKEKEKSKGGRGGRIARQDINRRINTHLIRF